MAYIRELLKEKNIRDNSNNSCLIIYKSKFDLKNEYN